MAPIERANGHRPAGLLHLLDPSLRLAPHPRQEEVSFNLDQALSSVLRLEATVPEEAFSAGTLGTERQGNAVVISDDGLVVTIGYLVMDADSVTLIAPGGFQTPAAVVGYHFESGLALVRAAADLDLDPIPIGDSADLKERDSVIIAPYGGIDHAIAGMVVSRREFAGSWEYLLDDAIFTAPIHPNWSGAGLIDSEGRLVGVGSLWVNDAQAGRRDSPGNMFVPIDLLKPIFDDLVTNGRASTEPRAWLGMYAAEAMGRLFVSGTIPDGPADLAGIEPGDLIVAVAGQPVSTLADMYRRIWSQGGAGTPILLNLRRDGDAIDVTVESASRYDFTRIFHSRH